MPPMLSSRPASALAGKKLLLNDERLTLVHATEAHGSTADATWPIKRTTADLHQLWLWKQILADHPHERFALVDDGDQPVAFWCSSKKSPIVLSGIRHYRLDYVEVRPQDRGGLSGYAVLALIAARAVERGADRLVLAAFDVPGLVDFYERTVGARRGCPAGWNPPPMLVPFVIEEKMLIHLKEFADALFEDGEA